MTTPKDETIPTHEGETALFFDVKGKPVDDPKDAHVIEIISASGEHTILARTDSTKDPLA